ncbi:cation transporter [Spirochaetia bacterium]|nr:cation transporter [Spirochaetia bacterium]
MENGLLSLLILACIIICFITRVIPLGIVAVLGALAMALTGIISLEDALSSFGSDTVMLILGMIVVGSALVETGFIISIGEKLTRLPGICNNERIFLVLVLLIVVMLSGFMSNTATVAVFLPIVASVARCSGGVISKKNTYMAIGISSIIGGNLTLAGSTPQIIAQGILSQTEGCEPMGFFDLAKGTFPLIITMLLYFASFGYRLSRKVFTFPEEREGEALIKETAGQPVRNGKALICGLIFLWCVVGFVFNIFTLGTVAIIAACLCIVTGCISVNRAAATMDWTSILVLGGSMGFSKGLHQSGALIRIADAVINLVGPAFGPTAMFGAFLVLAALMGNVMSHTATTAVLAPIAIAVAQSMGTTPTLFTVGVVIGCNLAFATPVSTPPLTMTLCGGYRFKDYVIVGGMLNLICVVIALVTLPLLYGV